MILLSLLKLCKVAYSFYVDQKRSTYWKLSFSKQEHKNCIDGKKRSRAVQLNNWPERKQ